MLVKEVLQRHRATTETDKEDKRQGEVSLGSTSSSSSSLVAHASVPWHRALLLKQTSGQPRSQARFLLPERGIPCISPPLSSLPALCTDETSDLLSPLGKQGWPGQRVKNGNRHI